MDTFIGFMAFGLILFILIKISTSVNKNKANYTTKPAGNYKKLYQTFDFMLVGYDFESDITGEPRKKQIKHLKEFDPVILEREPQNEYDKNAIKVYDMDGIDIGYISKKENRVIGRLIDEGLEIESYVKKILNSKIPIIIVEAYKVVNS